MAEVTPKLRARRRFKYGGLLVVLVVGLVATHRYALYDFVRLHDYTPSTNIAQLASDDGMTSYARHIYYVNHPQLDGRSVFAPHCPSGTEQTVVLGCYQSNQDGIYLLQVNNSQLNGIEQVTAAHETLHAAYDRLSSSDRNKVDVMLEDYYKHDLTDPTIKQTIADYKQSEPNDVVNEMHSVFGTEVASLPPSLESYYQRYFTDRSKITGYYARYQQAFTSRQTQIKQYDSQLSTQKTQIDGLESDISNKLTALNSQRTALTSDRSNGNDAAYNNDVSSYNQAVDTYNAEVNRLHDLIASYNQIVSARNTIALEEQQLTQSITSSTTTR